MGLMKILPGKPWKRGIDRDIMTAYLEGKQIDEVARQVQMTPGQVGSIEHEIRSMLGTKTGPGSVLPALRKGYLVCDYNEDWDGEPTPVLSQDQFALIRHLSEDGKLAAFGAAYGYNARDMTAFVRMLYRATGCDDKIALVRFGVEHALLLA